MGWQGAGEGGEEVGASLDRGAFQVEGVGLDRPTDPPCRGEEERVGVAPTRPQGRGALVVGPWGAGARAPRSLAEVAPPSNDQEGVRGEGAEGVPGPSGLGQGVAPDPWGHPGPSVPLGGVAAAGGPWGHVTLRPNACEAEEAGGLLGDRVTPPTHDPWKTREVVGGPHADHVIPVARGTRGGGPLAHAMVVVLPPSDHETWRGRDLGARRGHVI